MNVKISNSALLFHIGAWDKMKNNTIFLKS